MPALVLARATIWPEGVADIAREPTHITKSEDAARTRRLGQWFHGADLPFGMRPEELIQDEQDLLTGGAGR